MHHRDITIVPILTTAGFIINTNPITDTNTTIGVTENIQGITGMVNAMAIMVIVASFYRTMC